jgi:hypothetical protein
VTRICPFAGFREPVLDRDRGRHRAGAEEVVAAALTICPAIRLRSGVAVCTGRAARPSSVRSPGRRSFPRATNAVGMPATPASSERRLASSCRSAVVLVS